MAKPEVSQDYLIDNFRLSEDGKLFWAKPARGRSLAKQCGYVSKTDGYRYVGIGHSQYSAHRVVWAIYYGKWPELELDHINGNRDDNRITNLRLATSQQNKFNKAVGSNNTSGVTGVSWNSKHCHWMAQIKVGLARYNLGCFKDFDEAVAVRKLAEDKYFGEYRRIYE